MSVYQGVVLFLLMTIAINTCVIRGNTDRDEDETSSTTAMPTKDAGK